MVLEAWRRRTRQSNAVQALRHKGQHTRLRQAWRHWQQGRRAEAYARACRLRASWVKWRRWVLRMHMARREQALLASAERRSMIEEQRQALGAMLIQIQWRLYRRESVRRGREAWERACQHHTGRTLRRYWYLWRWWVNERVTESARLVTPPPDRYHDAGSAAGGVGGAWSTVCVSPEGDVVVQQRRLRQVAADAWHISHRTSHDPVHHATIATTPTSTVAWHEGLAARTPQHPDLPTLCTPPHRHVHHHNHHYHAPSTPRCPPQNCQSYPQQPVCASGQPQAYASVDCHQRHNHRTAQSDTALSQGDPDHATGHRPGNHMTQRTRRPCTAVNADAASRHDVDEERGAQVRAADLSSMAGFMRLHRVGRIRHALL